MSLKNIRTIGEPPVNVREATEQIDRIWTVLARNETFRGYRPVTVAATGLLGILSASFQPWVIPDASEQPSQYVLWWCLTAALAILMVVYELTLLAMRPDGGLRRKLMWQAIGQFLPALLVGSGLSATSLCVGSPPTELLPGLWALCFSLGIIASRPYLDATIVLAAAYYALLGFFGLMLSESQLSLSPWFMGCTFGLGQLFTAFLLHRSEGLHAQG